ncbi:DUF2290 domain-containing protein [Auraticoccus monumenti]|uniref:DUF2290 domain-containing protein n=1 Tax=Auraticoccus monumenti TaxID=675864 RepID=UPI000B81FDD1|nr:DUF2290 domain-containing protein [Auraticoccus monumenti]
MAPSSDSKWIVNDLRNIRDFFVGAGIAIDANDVYDGERGRLTWAPSPGAGSLFQFGVHTTLEDYQYWCLDRQYSLMLLDGSLLQVSYFFTDGQVYSHRLAYIPFPLAGDRTFASAYEVTEFVSNMHPEPSDVALQAVVRFDYDPSNARPGHAASHLTINRSSCRIEVRTWVALPTFIQLVFREFYPELWQAHDFLRGLGTAALLDQQPTFGAYDAPADPHVNWRPAVA